VTNPRDFNNQVMPVYGAEFGGAMTDEQLNNLAIFLEASKGPGGG
jgi:hypothetical protein